MGAPVTAAAPTTAPSARRDVLGRVLAAATCVLATVPIVRTSLLTTDSDARFILATGREIVRHGIPYVNPWSVHPGMRVVVQQWLFDVAYFGLDEAFGDVGPGLLVAGLAALLVLLLWRLSKVMAPALDATWRVTLTAFAMLALSPYIVHRPHVATMCITVCAITCLERWRRGSSWRSLAPLPALAIVEANCQAAMLALPIGCAVLVALPTPDVGRIEWAHAGYRRGPVWAAAALMCAASLLNPYGLDGSLYVLRSLGAASYGCRIIELMPVWKAAQHAPVITAVLVILSALSVMLVLARGRRVDLPLTLACAACVVGGTLATRNVWILVPFALALALETADDVRPQLPASGLLDVCVVMAVLCAASVGLARPATDAGLAGAAEALRGADGVCCTFNYGAWLELEGHRVSMDARPELWEPAISGTSDHWYRDYADAAESGDMAGYVESSGCSWALTVPDADRDDSHLDATLSGMDGWRVVYDSEGVRVWRRD